MTLRVAVLKGGRSSEHDVSLASGAAVAGGLREAGHDVVEVLVQRDGRWTVDGAEVTLRAAGGLLGCDAVFPVLHGPFGEDGTVQGLLELLEVPYVGAGVLASAACMDKVVFKDLMAVAGLPQVRYALVEEDRRDQADLAVVGFPCWVKPARLGSSVGIIRVADEAELTPALDNAFGHDPRVIVEANSRGLEVECSVLGHTDGAQASDPGEIVLLKGAGWYDYEAKYTEGGMRLQVPARISETARARVRELAVEAFRIAGCSGLARVDFFVDGEDVLLNELNTMPGQTSTSVYAKLWAASGIPYPQLLDRLVAIGVERAQRERAHQF
jgi:D-alanine-D-alanine ligase